MTPTGSVTRLIDLLQRGAGGEREAATAEVWKRYFPRLLQVATQRLSPAVRPRVDGDDVAQDVFAVFFARLERGEFNLANRDDLWAVLCQIARNKAMKAASREQAARRDYRREQRAAAEADEGALEWLATLGDPSVENPAEAATAAETLRALLASLDDAHRQVAVLRLRGHSHEEIAAELGCVVRTVERRMGAIRQAWEKAGE